MILNLFVTKTDDGFTATIPSLCGCDTWAHTEEEVLAKSVELARFYLRLPDHKPLKVDKAKDNFKQKTYKLIFDK